MRELKPQSVVLILTFLAGVAYSPLLLRAEGPIEVTVAIVLGVAIVYLLMHAGSEEAQ